MGGMKFIKQSILRYKRIIMASAALSAIYLITSAIASPNGITYYEDNMVIKYIEIIFSVLVGAWFLKDIFFEIKKVGEDA